MWLVADSGSTKTEWRLFNAQGIKETASSKGLNPLFISEDSFTNCVRKDVPATWQNTVSRLWFYCAGVDTEKVKRETTEWLQSVFTHAEVWVGSDLLAAARATCGTKQGIVAILGTGSNSGLYDGVDMVEHIRPLGYILGDEGSGTALGKSLLKKLLRGEFSEELSKSICSELGFSYEEILEHVYRSEWPNRFMASCSRVLHSHKNDREVRDLINKELGEFVALLCRYSNANEQSLNFVGSIACYFEENLREIVRENGLSIGKIIQSPIDDLVNYHSKNQ